MRRTHRPLRGHVDAHSLTRPGSNSTISRRALHTTRSHTGHFASPYFPKGLQGHAVGPCFSLPSAELQVLPLAVGGMHTMTIQLSYEGPDNSGYTENAVFRCMVEQKAALEYDVRGVARMSRTGAAKKRLIISGGWRIHGVRRFALPGEPGVQKKRKRRCAQSKRALGAFIYRKGSAGCRPPPRFSCFSIHISRKTEAINENHPSQRFLCCFISP